MYSYSNVFGIHLSNRDSGNVVRPNGNKPKLENPRWRPLYFDYAYLSLHSISTKFQRLNLCFEIQLMWKVKMKIQDGGLSTSMTFISSCTQDNNRFSTAITIFSGSTYHIRIVVMLCVQTGRNRR